MLEIVRNSQVKEGLNANGRPTGGPFKRPSNGLKFNKNQELRPSTWLFSSSYTKTFFLTNNQLILDHLVRCGQSDQPNKRSGGWRVEDMFLH